MQCPWDRNGVSGSDTVAYAWLSVLSLSLPPPSLSPLFHPPFFRQWEPWGPLLRSVCLSTYLLAPITLTCQVSLKSWPLFIIDRQQPASILPDSPSYVGTEDPALTWSSGHWTQTQFFFFLQIFFPIMTVGWRGIKTCSPDPNLPLTLFSSCISTTAKNLDLDSLLIVYFFVCLCNVLLSILPEAKSEPAISHLLDHGVLVRVL